jgi:hypothetical protein
MNQIAYPEVKLIVSERIRKAERRHQVAEALRAAQPSHVGGLFGLRRPILQGA